MLKDVILTFSLQIQALHETSQSGKRFLRVMLLKDFNPTLFSILVKVKKVLS